MGMGKIREKIVPAGHYLTDHCFIVDLNEIDENSVTTVQHFCISYRQMLYRNLVQNNMTICVLHIVDHFSFSFP
jgi:hypothetical protein